MPSVFNPKAAVPCQSASRTTMQPIGWMAGNQYPANSPHPEAHHPILRETFLII